MEVYQYLVYFVKAHPADNVDTKDVTEEEQSHDVATRLTAARSLGKCDSWGFDETVFKPYLEEAMQALLTLMDDVETIESRMRLMDILGVIIDRMGEAVGYTSKAQNRHPTDLSPFSRLLRMLSSY